MSGFAGILVDQAVVRAAQGGATDAHETLYRLFAPAVYTLALRIMNQPAKADDVLQETFMEVMKSIGKFRNEASLATWIRHIAVSKALMALRSAWERKGESLPDDPPSGSEAEWRLDNAMDLAAALATLAPLSRTVVWLHDVEGYTHREIAALTGKTTSFSKSRLARAHQDLRRMLAPPNDVLTTQTVPGSC